MKVTLLTTEVQAQHQLKIACEALSQCRQKEIDFDKLKKIAFVLQHQTVLEYFDLVFKIEGISFASHVHFVRHRLTTPMVQSQRATSPLEFVNPYAKDTAEYAELEKAYTEINEIINVVNEAINPRPQDLRYLVPQGVALNMVLKFNFREFLHILKLRNTPVAMPETQECARKMLEETQRIWVYRELLEEK